MPTLPPFVSSPETLLKPGQMNVSASTVQTRLSRAGSEPGEFAAGMCESDHLGCRMLMGQGGSSQRTKGGRGRNVTNCSDRPSSQHSISPSPDLNRPR